MLKWKIKEKRKENNDSNNIHHDSMYHAHSSNFHTSIKQETREENKVGFPTSITFSDTVSLTVSSVPQKFFLPLNPRRLLSSPLFAHFKNPKVFYLFLSVTFFY